MIPLRSTQTSILLDFDGVINADRAHRVWDHARRRTTFYANGMAWTITYSPKALNALRNLRAQYGCKILMSSTWCTEPLDQFEDIGLHFDDKAFLGCLSADVAKFEAFNSISRSGFPTIWVDDSSIPSHLENTNTTLLIRPDDRYGITPEHIEEMEAFLSRVSC